MTLPLLMSFLFNLRTQHVPSISGFWWFGFMSLSMRFRKLNVINSLTVKKQNSLRRFIYNYKKYLNLSRCELMNIETLHVKKEKTIKIYPYFYIFLVTSFFYCIDHTIWQQKRRNEIKCWKGKTSEWDVSIFQIFYFFLIFSFSIIIN